MSRDIADAGVTVTFTDPTGASFTADAIDLGDPLSPDTPPIEIRERTRESRDIGKIRLVDTAGEYTKGIDPGDRVTVDVSFQSGPNYTWEGLLRRMKPTNIAGTQAIELECDDFVYGVLSIRKVTAEFETRQIAGTSDSIVNTIVSNNAPEIGLGGVGSVTKTTDIVYQDRNLLEAVLDMADRAEVYMANDGTDLVFAARNDQSPQFEMNSSDYKGGLSVDISDDGLVNDAIVVGGRDSATDIKQETHDATTTVTNSSRFTEQVRVRGNEVGAVSLWVNKTGSGDNLVVRIQAEDPNNAGQPASPGNRAFDLARKTLPASDLVDQDWNKFTFAENKIPDPNPFIIVESDGSSGQSIGVDTSTDPDTLAYRVFFPFPVTATSTNEASINEFRRHEARRRRETISTTEEARDMAQTLTNRADEPAKQFTITADSERMWTLDPGEYITTNNPDLRIDEQFQCTQKRVVLNKNNANADLTFMKGARTI